MCSVASNTYASTCAFKCMTVANVSANKSSTIPRQCHPAAITQMVMDNLCFLLGDVTRSELVIVIIIMVALLYITIIVIPIITIMEGI